MRNHARFLVPLVAAALLLGISCAHMTMPAGQSPSKGPVEIIADSTHCPGGHGHANKNGPVVCIDAESLMASPEAPDVRRGAWVHFYLTAANQELDIAFDEPAKVEFKGKRGNECWVRVRDDAGVGKAKYTAINVSTGKKNDPTIIIQPMDY